MGLDLDLDFENLYSIWTQSVVPWPDTLLLDTWFTILKISTWNPFEFPTNADENIFFSKYLWRAVIECLQPKGKYSKKDKTIASFYDVDSDFRCAIWIAFNWWNQWIVIRILSKSHQRIMLLMRKAAKRIIFLALLLCILYGCYTFFLSGEPLEYQNNRYKLWVFEYRMVSIEQKRNARK